MSGFSTINEPTLAYDPSKDGVWLGDGTEAQVFIPRNVIIQMIGQLPASPPKPNTHE